MKTLLLTAAAILALAGCTGKKASTQAEATLSDSITETAVSPIVGEWDIENVVINDSLYARPAEIDAAVKQYILFNADSTYVVRTNCNTISGTYMVEGDSITLGDGFTTEMACDNMQVEDLIKQVIPEVTAIDFQNDSIVRLNAPSGKHIVLHKAAERTE